MVTKTVAYWFSFIFTVYHIYDCQLRKVTVYLYKYCIFTQVLYLV